MTSTPQKTRSMTGRSYGRLSGRARTARHRGGNTRMACPAHRRPPGRGTAASCPRTGPSRPATNPKPAPVPSLNPTEVRRSPGQPLAGGLALTFPADPVVVAAAPAPLAGPLQAGLDRLDLAGVMLDVQRRSADPGIRVFLEPLHLAAEALIQRESGSARAYAMQRPVRIQRGAGDHTSNSWHFRQADAHQREPIGKRTVYLQRPFSRWSGSLLTFVSVPPRAPGRHTAPGRHRRTRPAGLRRRGVSPRRVTGRRILWSALSNLSTPPRL